MLQIVLGIASYGHSFYVTTTAAVDAAGNVTLYPPFDKTKQPLGDSDAPGTASASKCSFIYQFTKTDLVYTSLQAQTHAEILEPLLSAEYSTSREWFRRDSWMLRVLPRKESIIDLTTAVKRCVFLGSYMLPDFISIRSRLSTSQAHKL